MPETSIDKALEVAERIQNELRQVRLEHANSPISIWVTFSIGVACLQPQINQAPISLIEMADQALYQAKEQGRNRINVYH